MCVPQVGDIIPMLRCDVTAACVRTCMKMKLQSHVRGQNGGSWVCPVHLDYFQLADMCISRVFMWFEAQNLSNCNF